MITSGPKAAVSRAGARARRRFEDDGFDVELWSLGPGGELVGLDLADAGTLYVDAGAAVVHAGGETHRLGPGQRLELPRGETYAIESVGEGPLLWLAAARTIRSDAPGRRPPRRARRR